MNLLAPLIRLLLWATATATGSWGVACFWFSFRHPEAAGYALALWAFAAAALAAREAT